MNDEAMSNILGALINKNNGGFGGSNDMWGFLLVLLLAGGNGGFGWGNNGANTALMANVATQNDVFTGFTMQNLGQGLQSIGADISRLGYSTLEQSNATNTNVLQTGFGIQQAITNGNYAISDKLGNVGNGIMMAVTQNGYGTQQGLNGVGQNIDRLRYDTALQTCSINETATANTQKILDRLCQLETAQLQSKVNELQVQNQALQLTIGNTTQTAEIIKNLRPYPVPAYTVSSPYVGTTTAPATGG